MATYQTWTYPTAYAITGTTKIKDADNNIQAGLNDLENWANDAGTYTGSSLKTYVDAAIAEWYTSWTEDTGIVEW